MLFLIIHFLSNSAKACKACQTLVEERLPPTESPTTSFPTITAVPTSITEGKSTLPSESIAPSSLPSSNSKCVDNKDFFMTKNNKTCDWIAASKNNMKRFCLRPIVDENCPQTCRKRCCEDDEDFTFKSKNGVDRKCGWLKKRLKVKRDEFCNSKYMNLSISAKCPESCGICEEEPSPSYAPSFRESTPIVPTKSMQPSASPSATCIDNKDFFITKKYKTCDWIAASKKNMKRFCLRPGVTKNCPQSCRETCCKDDGDFTFKSKNGVDHNCTWLQNQNQMDRDGFCNSMYMKISISAKCPQSCGVCEAESSPSSVPSVHPSISPTKSMQPSVSPSATCVNNEKFFMVYESKTCDWVSNFFPISYDFTYFFIHTQIAQYLMYQDCINTEDSEEILFEARCSRKLSCSV